MSDKFLSFYYKVHIYPAFILALFGTTGSLLAQYALKLDPCNLCIFQRVAIMATAFLALVALFLPLRYFIVRVISLVMISLPAIFGWGVALRQIYIQHLPPDQVPTCGPGLSFLLKTETFSRMLSLVLSGSGECAKVEKILFVPLPVWSIMLFSLILIVLWLGFWLGHKMSQKDTACDDF